MATNNSINATIPIPAGSGGTGNAFYSVTGTTTSVKTFTYPNASSTALTSNSAVTVAQGGTGLTSGTQGGVPWFNSTSGMASSGALTSNGIMLGGGTLSAPAAGSDFTYSGGSGGIVTANILARWTIKTSNASAANEADVFMERNTTSGYAQVGLFTNGTADWYLGTRADGSADYQYYSVSAGGVSFKFGASTSDFTALLGNIVINTGTKGLKQKSTTVSAGTANGFLVTGITLTAGASGTINNSVVTTNCVGMASIATAGGTPGAYYVTCNSGSFTVTSTSATDTSTVNVFFVLGV